MYVESRRTTEESISTILQLLLFFTKSSQEYILFYAHSAPLFLSPYSLLLLNFFSLFILVFIRQRRKSYQEQDEFVTAKYNAEKVHFRHRLCLCLSFSLFFLGICLHFFSIYPPKSLFFYYFILYRLHSLIYLT